LPQPLLPHGWAFNTCGTALHAVESPSPFMVMGAAFTFLWRINMQYAVNKIGDRYTVANSLKIICYLATRSEAIASLVAEGVTDAESILDQQTDTGTFRSTVMAGIVNELKDTSATVDTLPTNKTTDHLNQRLDIVTGAVANLSADIEADRRRAEIRDRIRILEADLESRIPVLKATGDFHGLTDGQIRVALFNNSPIGAEIQQLREQL
jgi:hypothetical protein